MHRLLIIGCGDVLKRALPWLTTRFEVYATARSPAAFEQLRALGIKPIRADLDQRNTLGRLAGIADVVIHSVPPQSHGTFDYRTRALLAALLWRGSVPRRLIYISTSGVYGDYHGELIDETAPLKTISSRALRRVDAESQLKKFAVRNRCNVVILRAPGIYASNRLPIERLLAGTPAIVSDEDSYSSHIHADDLALAAALATFRGKTARAINVCDDAQWKMGEWFERVAHAHGLPPPERLTRVAVQSRVSPMLWSFLAESRRLKNRRMKHELRLTLAYPTPDKLLEHIRTITTER